MPPVSAGPVDRASGGRRDSRKVATADDAVDDPVLHRLRGVHDIVPIDIALDLFERMSGGAREDLVQDFPRPQNLPGLNVDVRRLPAQSARMRLVDQDLAQPARKSNRRFASAHLLGRFASRGSSNARARAALKAQSEKDR